MTWAEISPAVVAVAAVSSALFVAVSAVAAVLFGVSHMIENHKKSNKTDLDELGKKIGELGDSVQKLTVSTTAVGKDVEYLRRDVDWHLLGRSAPVPAAPAPAAAGPQAAPAPAAAGPQAAAEPLAAAGPPAAGS